MNVEGIQKSLDHHGLGAQPLGGIAHTTPEAQEYHVRKPKASAIKLAAKKQAAEAAAKTETNRQKQARRLEHASAEQPRHSEVCCDPPSLLFLTPLLC